MEAGTPEVLPCSPWDPATAPVAFLLELTVAWPSCLPDRHGELAPALLWQLAVPPGLLSVTGCNLPVLGSIMMLLFWAPNCS